MTRKLFAVFQILAACASAALLALPHTADAALTLTPRLSQTFVPALTAGNPWSFTSSSFTPSNNSLLVVVMNAIDNNLNLATDNWSISGGGLMWTKRQFMSNSFSPWSTAQVAWTARVTTGASMTVTVTHTATATADNRAQIHVMDVTGYNTFSPIGAIATGNDSQGAGAATITLSSAPATSSIVLGYRSFNPSGSGSTAASPGSGWTSIYDTNTTAGWIGLQTQRRTASVSTSVSWADLDTSGDTAAASYAGAIEIKAGGTLVKPPNNLGLVGYWPMDEGTSTQAGDFSGNGNTGTLFGGPSWVNGKRGKALSFDGGGTQYVDVGQPSSLNISGAVTISAWIKPSANCSTGCTIVGDDNAGDTNEQYVMVKGLDDTIGICDQNASTWECWNGSIPLKNNTNTWYHVAVTRNASNTTKKVFINGVDDFTVHGGSGFPSISTSGYGNTAIGRNGSQDSSYFPGVIDDVRIYNRELATSSIQALYAGGTAGAARANASSVTLQNGTTLGPANGLVGHWTFDGADVTNSSIYDRSGQNNNGYFIGGATSSAKTIGKLGQALNFVRTSSQYVDVRALANDVQSGSFSVSAWFKFASVPAGTDQVIFDVGDGPSTNDFAIMHGGSDCFYACDNAVEGWHTAIGTNIIIIESTNKAWTTADWHHAVYTLSTVSGAAFYIDGVLNGTDPDGSRGTTLATHASIGSFTDGSNSFNGKIDDVRIYNRALTAAEVKQLYKLGGVTIKQ